MNSIIAFQDYAYQFSNELITFFELLEQKSIVEKYKMAASSIFYKVKSSRTKEINWEEILKTALLDEENLIRNAETKYSKITSARIQEKIKIKGALIRSMACKNKAYDFSNRTKLRTEIEKMMHMNSTLGGFVLAEIMTQEIEPHK